MVEGILFLEDLRLFGDRLCAIHPCQGHGRDVAWVRVRQVLAGLHRHRIDRNHRVPIPCRGRGRGRLAWRRLSCTRPRWLDGIGTVVLFEGDAPAARDEKEGDQEEGGGSDVHNTTVIGTPLRQVRPLIAPPEVSGVPAGR